MTHVLAAAIGYLAGAVTIGVIAVVLRHRIWGHRHRPNRYEEIL